jgi:mono/diheme cytochrome c family protein
MRRILLVLVALAVVGFGAFYLITAPKSRSAAEFAGLTPDAAKGEAVFWAAGCAACHAAPGSKGEALLVLAGGQSFPTAFGTFIAPNISPHPQAGIGGWDVLTFANAVMAGVTPEGAHEYPAMPFTAYAHMDPQDLVNLKAFMDTLPASAQENPDHQLGFPFNIRLSLGGWKFLFGTSDWVMNGDLTPEQQRGRYIVEALAHCGECHTPRNALGGLETSKWLGGAAMPDGKGKVPNITPGKLTWSKEDIFTYLTTGATPEFDFVGGAMSEVVNDLARLPEADVWAVVAYLKSVPPVQ